MAKKNKKGIKNVATGAIVGGVLFGVPGAVVGGCVGHSVSGKKKGNLESQILDKVKKGTNKFTDFLFGEKIFPKGKK